MTETDKIIRPLSKSLFYGHGGAGKSTLASTWPKPMLVLSFDDISKTIHPYQRGAKSVSEILYREYDGFKIPYIDCEREDGLVRVEFFVDYDMENPTAICNYQSRAKLVAGEIAEGKWKTVVIDNLTGMSLAARKRDEHVINPTCKNQMQWFGTAVNVVEEELCSRIKSWMCYVIAILHESHKDDRSTGEVLRGHNAPGRLGKEGIMSSVYGEQYRCYHQLDAEGNTFYAVQTKGDQQYNCFSHLSPDPISFPHFDSLFKNWDEEVRKKKNS